MSGLLDWNGDGNRFQAFSGKQCTNVARRPGAADNGLQSSLIGDVVILIEPLGIDRIGTAKASQCSCAVHLNRNDPFRPGFDDSLPICHGDVDKAEILTVSDQLLLFGTAVSIVSERAVASVFRYSS